MKISTKTWCQPPEVLRGIAKVLFVAMLTVGLGGILSTSAEAATTTMEQNPTKVTLKGKVVDENGNPLPGASVAVKNTSIGMSTTKDGKFSLNVSDEKLTLIVTYVGYQKVERTIVTPSKEKELTFTLLEDELETEEVVVTGFINARKSSFTGTQTTIKKEELMSVSPTNLLSAITVFEPSLRMIENIEMGSDPNTMPEAYMRGQSGMSNRQLDVAESLSPYETQTNPNLPIFILDGFEISMERFNDLDPNTVESITILKDAQATALYGSRASNGVLIITSIPPQAGKLRFNYSTTLSVTAPDLRDYHLLNAKDKLAQEVASGYYEDVKESAAYLTSYNNYMLKNNNILRGVDTYWLSQPLTTQFNQNHNLTIQGGTDEFRFSFAVRYQNENGVMKDSYRDVYNAEIGLEYRIPGLSIQNKVGLGLMERQNSPYGSFSTFSQLLPYDSPYDLNTGELTPKLKGWGGSGRSDYTNPLYDVHMTENSDQGNYKEFTNNLLVNYMPHETLNIKGQFSVSQKDEATEIFKDPRAAEFDKYVYTYGGA
ncbi:MAG: carboxypeptidase-like regulatory domain-containing protein, partial [Rikenellaceae bacterium]|nr:carboxypeptidase-like regulatory domain-containing protein [Rikenellaceae bacterium]